jgi:aconitate hydratase
MYLGVKAVLAISFARIHQANLVNFGIAPLAFVNEADYAHFQQADEVEIAGIREALARGDEEVEVRNLTRALAVRARLELGARARRTLLAGGLLNSVRWATPAAADGATATDPTPAAAAER